MSEAVMDDVGQNQDENGQSEPKTGLPSRFDAKVEAVLLSGDRAIEPRKIAEAFGDARVTPSEVLNAVDRLNTVYDEGGRSFRIERVAGGLRLMTRPAFASVVASFQRGRQSTRLSRAALETLSIVAYKQPITRAQLEAIRGVACGEVLRSLLERKLVAIKGRADELGRPMLYGTTKGFLELFGLSSVRDLPAIGDLLPPAADLEDEIESATGKEAGADGADETGTGGSEPSDGGAA